MTKSKKAVCIILAVLIALSTAVGIVIYLYKNFGATSSAFSAINTASISENSVNFRNDVCIANDPKEIQKSFDRVEFDNSEYTIFYKTSIPDYFNSIKTGEVFFVYPDGNAKESFFALGFCGKLTAINTEDCSVSFIIPEITEVFSDIHIDTKNADKNSLISTAFYPDENVTQIPNAQVHNTPQSLKCSADLPLTLSSSVSEDSLEIGDTTIGYKYKEPKAQSMLDDYVMICDELTLNLEHKSSDNELFAVKGNVTLEETALKMLLDYHYDESSDTVTINDCSMGLITKQKIDLKFSGKGSIGADDLLKEEHIIDIEDVTESEEGKIVLGTYLIGWEAALPILQNSNNKVSYLSLGIAVQFSITASGELSLEYNIKESGFAQIETNGDGENKTLIKGYDYPNPVKESRRPTEEESQSKPSVTSEIKGEASFDMAFGGDIGICILGMIPIKQANNFLEFEITRGFSDTMSEDKATKVMNNNHLLDENVNYLALSSNSYLKMHLGAKVKFGILKYTLAEADGKFQIYDNAWFQYPPAAEFSHSQCGFGGVFVGEAYSDEELEEAYNSYMEEAGQKSIITTAKDSLLGSVINEALNNRSLENIVDISSLIGVNADSYKFNYFTSGIIYARDENDTVVAAVVTGEDISNAAGIHNGLSPKKLEQVYSSPDLYAEAEINIGSILKFILGIDWEENEKITESVYYSKDSDENMSLLFCDDSLKLIIIS